MWDTKYRPLKFGDVLGQEGAIQLLKARLAKGTALDTNYIFAGGHGQGKTTLGRIVARAMLCLNLDKANPEPCNDCENCTDILRGTATAFVEQDAASGGTIDNIRGIVEDLPFAVFNAPKRVYIFDEAHRMSRDAQDVLLKPLEEKKMVGIFCTTEPEKIRGPIRSRCEEYVIRKITRDDVLVRMKRILEAEGVPYEDDAVLTVIDYSGGHVRDVLNRLEMIGQMGDISLTNVREYLHLSAVATYYEILLSLADSRRAVELVELACERVPAEDVSAGLAEAAMNSFRLAHNMFTDFVYVDKAMAQKVWEIYGQQTVRLAEHFLRSRYATKVSLLCDVLALQSGVPTQGAVSPPVLIQIAPVASPASPGVAPFAPVVQAPLSVAQPVSAPPTPLPRPAPPSANPKGLRGDGVGNVGSADAYALTENDVQAVAKNWPRMRHTQLPSTAFTVAKNPELSEILTPDAWRREFEKSWDQLGRRG